jgi:hypothetical protein
MVGIILTVLIGAIVRSVQGGTLPRKVRRGLIVNLIAKYPDVVGAAFPGLEGDALFKRLETVIEGIGNRSVQHAPSNSVVWTESVVTTAIAELLQEAPTHQMKDLYRVILEQIRTDWYEVSYLRGVVEP